MGIGGGGGGEMVGWGGQRPCTNNSVPALVMHLGHICRLKRHVQQHVCEGKLYSLASCTYCVSTHSVALHVGLIRSETHVVTNWKSKRGYFCPALARIVYAQLLRHPAQPPVHGE